MVSRIAVIMSADWELKFSTNDCVAGMAAPSGKRPSVGLLLDRATHMVPVAKLKFEGRLDFVVELNLLGVDKDFNAGLAVVGDEDVVHLSDGHAEVLDQAAFVQTEDGRSNTMTKRCSCPVRNPRM